MKPSDLVCIQTHISSGSCREVFSYKMQFDELGYFLKFPALNAFNSVHELNILYYYHRS